MNAMTFRCRRAELSRDCRLQHDWREGKAFGSSEHDQGVDSVRLRLSRASLAAVAAVAAYDNRDPRSAREAAGLARALLTKAIDGLEEVEARW